MKHFLYWLSAFLWFLFILTINLLIDFKIDTFVTFMQVFVALILPSIISVVIFERFLPESLYSANKKYFKSHSFEKNFYNKINVKKWKDSIPTFMKTKNIGQDMYNFQNGRKSDYINFFLSESRKAELLHKFYIFSSLIVLVALIFTQFDIAIKMGIPIFLIWSLYNFMSIILQRYNRPRLTSMLEKMKQREQSFDALDPQDNKNQI